MKPSLFVSASGLNEFQLPMTISKQNELMKVRPNGPWFDAGYPGDCDTVADGVLSAGGIT